MPGFSISWFVPVASIAASAIAGWMAIKTRGAGHLPGCRESSGCAAIVATKWSRWLTLPVAALGAVVYFGIGVISAIGSPSRISGLHQTGIILALFIGATSIWFIFLQAMVLRRFCLYCNLVHGLGLTICLACLTGFGSADAHSLPDGLEVVTAGTGLLLVILGQVFAPHRTYALIPSAADGHVEHARETRFIPRTDDGDYKRDAASPFVSAKENNRALPIPSRQIILRSGKLRVNTSDWPILGSPDAFNVVALAFDYTCPVCRTVHTMLEQLVRESSGNLAVLLLPIPQHPACNRLVLKVCPGHAQACQYSRIGLALWTSHPDRYEDFNAFMFADKEVPPLGLAMRRYEAITGGSINPHARDERFDKVIARAVEIYDGFKVKQIPNLLLSNAELPGQVETVEELRLILEREHKPQGADERPVLNEA